MKRMSRSEPDENTKGKFHAKHFGNSFTVITCCCRNNIHENVFALGAILL